jgi:hypothetical protein
MNILKWIVFAGSLLLVAVAGLICWLIYNQDYFQETSPKSYNNFEEVKQSGAIQRGWIPDFLPVSSTRIYEKHNFDYNRGIVAFKCNPADFSGFETKLEQVQASSWKEIAPSWLARKEPWFPTEIVEGTFSKPSLQGFAFYRIGEESGERILNGKVQMWYMAINRESGQCYVWY